MDSLEQQQHMQGRPPSHSKYSSLWLEHAGQECVQIERDAVDQEEAQAGQGGAATAETGGQGGYLICFLHFFSFCLSYLSWLGMASWSM